MNTPIDDFIENKLILIPEGIEHLRRFRDRDKWLSSNYQMSIPSKGHNQKEEVKLIKIASFQMAQYPVTNQLYHTVSGSDERDPTRSLQPKVNVSWYDAISFCNRISRFFGLDEYYLISNDPLAISCRAGSKGFRLPTEAEWQYACKTGGKSYQYSDIDTIAWHKENSGGSIHRIGEKEPNSWKLYDMLGNIWEWCWDLFNPETYASYRIFRGGSFAEEARVCGATTRRKSHPDFAIDDLGFRLAKSI